MVMLNDLDRFHLVIDVIDNVPSLGSAQANLRQKMVDERLRAREYTREYGDDLPEVRDWVWPDAQDAGRLRAGGGDAVDRRGQRVAPRPSVGRAPLPAPRSPHHRTASETPTVARSIYVTSPEGDSGKSMVALGLVDLLARTVQRVGVFRPVARSTDVRDYVLELLLAPRRRRPHVRRVRRGDVRAGAGRPGGGARADRVRGTTTSSGGATPSSSSAPTTRTSPDRRSWRTTPGSPRTSARPWCSSSTAAHRKPAVVAQVADVVVTEMHANHAQVVAVVANRCAPGSVSGVRDALRDGTGLPVVGGAREPAAHRADRPAAVGGGARARSSRATRRCCRARCSTSSSAPCPSSTCWAS